MEYSGVHLTSYFIQGTRKTQQKLEKTLEGISVRATKKRSFFAASLKLVIIYRLFEAVIEKIGKLAL